MSEANPNEPTVVLNVKYFSKLGFDAHVRIVCDSVPEFASAQEELFSLLEDTGCSPLPLQSRPPAAVSPPPPDDGPYYAPVVPPAAPVVGSHYYAPPPHEGFCQVHQVQMTKRSAKDGSGHEWYSHKAPDGTWCRG